MSDEKCIKCFKGSSHLIRYKVWYYPDEGKEDVQYICPTCLAKERLINIEDIKCSICNVDFDLIISHDKIICKKCYLTKSFCFKCGENDKSNLIPLNQISDELFVEAKSQCKALQTELSVHLSGLFSTRKK